MKLTAWMMAGVGLVLAGCAGLSSERTDPVIGNWGAKLPYDNMCAGSLIFSRGEDGAAKALVLWRWASPEWCSDVKIEGKSFSFRHPYGQLFRGTVCGDKLCGSVAPCDKEGKATREFMPFEGWRNPEIEPANVKDAKLGEPIDLLKDGLDGWKAMSEGYFGWSFKDGVLSNRVPRDKDGKKTGHGVNLITKRADFMDFNLSYDVRVPAGSNSGVYLRGRYEIQTLDSYGKGLDRHNMAALYGRLTPKVSAEKKAGEWQHVDVTLYRRHITVILNGTTIIENEPVEGVTGGAIDANEFVPGPMYIQGDHSDADYRNMILRPAASIGCACVQPNCGDLMVNSPDGHNAINLYVCEKGLAYEVVRDGVVVVAKSPIGLKVDGRCLAKGARVKSSTFEKKACCEAASVYKKGSVDLTANERFVDFGDWGVRLVARNDGVAYRFETKMAGEITVDCERAELAIPDASAKCWANYTGGFGQEESRPVATTARELRTAEAGTNWMGRRMIYLPLVYTVGGKYVAVTESDVRDYPIWNFTRDEKASDTTLRPLFECWPKKTGRKADWAPGKPFVATGGRQIVVTEREDYLVKTDGTRTFPWRTFVLADAPVKFCEADIVRALAPAADKGADYSWVKPGKVAWDWWNCWDNKGEAAGCTTKGYERFIDFAAKTGVEYVIFDEGWSESLNIWKFHPNVDVPHLIDYANKKGVGIILWMAWAQVYGDEERVASHFAKLGAKGFKVDFMDRGDADCARFLEKFARVCAKHKMLVDYHGAYRPNGLQRRYPNVLNYEGIHGLEQMKWFKGGEAEEKAMMFNDVAAFYLRLTAGPMDYTPGAMLNHAIGAGYKGGGFLPGSVGTRCRQMAMMALYEAPLQMLSDSPTNYEKNMESFTFMAKTPVVWEKTIGLAGCPDSMAVAARQAKDGSWYVAGITTAEARDYDLDTSFLGGGEWKVEIFQDGKDADKNGASYEHKSEKIVSGAHRTLHMAPGGGFVARFSK